MKTNDLPLRAHAIIRIALRAYAKSKEGQGTQSEYALSLIKDVFNKVQA